MLGKGKSGDWCHGSWVENWLGDEDPNWAKEQRRQIRFPVGGAFGSKTLGPGKAYLRGGQWRQNLSRPLQPPPLALPQFQQFLYYFLLGITTPTFMLKYRHYFGRRPDLPWPALNKLVWMRLSAWPSGKRNRWQWKEGRYYLLKENHSSALALTDEGSWEHIRRLRGYQEGMTGETLTSMNLKENIL